MPDVRADNNAYRESRRMNPEETAEATIPEDGPAFPRKHPDDLLDIAQKILEDVHSHPLMDDLALRLADSFIALHQARVFSMSLTAPENTEDED